jgi:hypothetical protein
MAAVVPPWHASPLAAASRSLESMAKVRKRPANQRPDWETRRTSAEERPQYTLNFGAAVDA